MTSNSDKIEKLNSTNYDTWSLVMECILKSRKLWSSMFEVHDEEKALTEDEIAKNEEAKAIIYSAMTREEIQKSGHSESAGLLWLKIKENHEGLEIDQRNVSLSEFMQFSYNKGEHITAYCGRFEMVLAKTIATGVPLDESLKFHVFRNNLPKDIKQLANFWMMANPDGKIASLMTSLKLQHHLDKREATNNSVALFGSNKSKKEHDKNNSKNNERDNERGNNGKYCTHCKKKGHLVNDCWTLKRKEAKQNDQSLPGPSKRSALSVLDKIAMTKHDWIIDSGASWHMTSNKDLLSDYEDLDEPREITIGDGKEIFARGKGKFSFKSGKFEGDLFDVMWVPGLSENLLSVGHATKRGNRVEFGKSEAIFSNKFGVCLKGRKILGNLFVVELEPQQTTKLSCGSSNMANVSIDEWHKRFAHSSTGMIKSLVRQSAVDGLKINNVSSENCADCVMGKITRASHPSRSSIKADENCAILHIDTCGPFEPDSLGGSRYFVLAVEEYSNYKLIEFVSSKSEIADVVKLMINRVQLESKRPVKMILTDNGTEFINSNLKIFLLNEGIIHEKTAVYTPEQNGTVERANRTIVEGIRTLLHESRLPRELWAEAANTVVYTTNRLLGPRSNNKTRYELYWHDKPDVGNLRIFGSAAVIHITKSRRPNKLHKKGTNVHFVGYTDRRNTYRFYDSQNGAIITSCDAKFVEHGDKLSNVDEPAITVSLTRNNSIATRSREYETAGHDSVGFESASRPSQQINSMRDEFNSDTQSPANYDANNSDNSMNGNDNYQSTEEQSDIETNLSDNNNDDDDNQLAEQSSPNSDDEQVERRATRSTTNSDDLIKSTSVPVWFWRANFALLTLDNEPETLREAMESDDWQKWKAAMDEEIAALNKNKTWQLVDKPRGRKIIKSKWVFKLKHDPEGNIQRYKARLVAKGYSQIPNIDYKETYAPVASSTTIRIVFALAAQSGMKLLQFDVKTAFLYGDLNETLHMEFPDGYSNPGNKVCRLTKSLYGLKQAPRQWNIKFNDFLTKFNLKRSEIDRCLYFNEERTLILAIYVDDGLAASSNSELLEELTTYLKSKFDVKFMACESYLGFKVEQRSNEIFISQTPYINKVLSRFNMSECKPSATPEEVGSSGNDDESPLPDNYPFRDLVGCLLYIVTCTRPDIAHAVSVASRTAKPTMLHWQKLKRILRYLKGTTEYGIRFRREENAKLIAYSDADYANDASRRSTTGWVILYGSSPIAWRCHRQSIITLSTTEAEYVSGCDLVKELLPIRESMLELHAIKDMPTDVLIDNLSTVKIANDDGGQKRTKHIDIRSKWLNEQSEKRKIAVKHVSGDKQLADMLTKPLHKTKFQANRNVLLSALTLLSLCAMISATSFVRVDPVDFEPSNFHYLNKPEAWNVQLFFPNLCPIYFDTASITDKIRADCESDYDRMLSQGKLMCNDPQLMTRIKIMPKIIYPDRSAMSDYSIPYFMGLSGQRAEKLSELALGPINNEARTSAIKQKKMDIVDYMKSTMDDNLHLQSRLDNETNTLVQTSRPIMLWAQTTARIQNYRYWFREYDKTFQRLNNQLAEGGLKADFPLWQNISITDEASGQLAQVFDCSREIDNLGLNLNLTFIAPKADPAIEFYEAVAFNFYNVTRIENKTRESICWMAYHGPKYIMVNTTNNCMTEVATELISNDSHAVPTCETPTNDLKDYASRMWHKEFCTSDVIPMKSKIQIKHYNGYRRVYCFPFNLTLDNNEQKCPSYVFEIDSNANYKIADLELINETIGSKIKSTQMHLLRDLRSTLKIDEIQFGAKKFVSNIGAFLNDSHKTVSGILTDGQSKISNFTSSVSSHISESAKNIQDKVSKGFKSALDEIWSYIEWAGIVLSVIAAGFLLLLAAPILEILFVAIKVVKIPYRKSVASVTRLIGKVNKSTIKSTNRYINEAKMRFVREREKLLPMKHRASRMV